MSLKRYILNKLSYIYHRIGDFIRWDQWRKNTWSQEGEDIFLYRIFDIKKNGFYVDVGAHHPKRFSNTYLFYLNGWSGINIDAMPNSMELFRKFRPRDINLETGVAMNGGSLKYYAFNEPALNGFSEDLSNERDETSKYHIKEVIDVNVKPLKDILDEYAGSKKIDFLTVDVEGFDLEVLRSNDWVKYRPGFVLAEVIGSDLNKLKNDPLVKYMNECGYKIYGKLVNTVIFKEVP